METNTQAAVDLLDLVQRHTERLVRLIQGLDRAKLNDENDPQTATIYRHITKFETCVCAYRFWASIDALHDSVLTSAVQTAEGRRTAPFLYRFLGRSTIKSDLQQCRSQLASVHSELNVSLSSQYPVMTLPDHLFQQDYLHSETYINTRKLLVSGIVVSSPKADPPSVFESAVSKIRMIGAVGLSYLFLSL